MSKFTKCVGTLESILNIDIDQVPGQEQFLHLFFQIQDLESKDDAKFDPRKYKNVLKEFQHLLSLQDYARVCKEFRQQVKLLLKQVLDDQDVNYHTPLHISSYFGDFKQSRLFTLLGAEASSAASAEPPLTVAQDSFTRGVLQNLNEAAFSTNVKDLQYLVNCGENIDSRQSIVGQAPIHKAVLSSKGPAEKEVMLKTIFKNNADINIIDSNGWTALHHAAYNGDINSVKLLIQSNANVNAFSN
mmetsp:Transcript_17521/g.29541  ORF Transcript_17521/g.29541 Transcript_17521/m.29541 type:complete len:244 (+) Transcript_17521:676-1407(+)